MSRLRGWACRYPWSRAPPGGGNASARFAPAHTDIELAHAASGPATSAERRLRRAPRRQCLSATPGRRWQASRQSRDQWFRSILFPPAPARRRQKVSEAASMCIQPGEGLFRVLRRGPVFHGYELFSDAHRDAWSNTKSKRRTQSKVKSGGQECPPHTFSFRYASGWR
jgi:hypothetical protein